MLSKLSNLIDKTLLMLFKSRCDELYAKKNDLENLHESVDNFSLITDKEANDIKDLVKKQ